MNWIKFDHKNPGTFPKITAKGTFGSSSEQILGYNVYNRVATVVLFYHAYDYEPWFANADDETEAGVTHWTYIQPPIKG